MKFCIIIVYSASTFLDLIFVFFWLLCDVGQLGHSVERLSSISSDPFPIDLGSGDDPIVSIGAGSRHSFAILKSQKIFAWGFNKFGQLGLGDFDNRLLPTQVNLTHLIDSNSIPSSKSSKIRVQCGRWLTLLYYDDYS